MAIDQAIHDALVVAITLGFIAWASVGLLRGLGRRRPELQIGGAVAIAIVARLVALPLVEVLGGRTLRGNDEVKFLGEAAHLASCRSLPPGGPTRSPANSTN